MEKYNCYKTSTNDILISHETKGIISIETASSIAMLKEISELDYKIIIDGVNMQLVSVGNNYCFIIEKYNDLLNNPNFELIKKNFRKRQEQYGIDFITKKRVSRKPKRTNKYNNAIARRGIPLVLVGSIGLGIIGYNILSKNKDNEEPDSTKDDITIGISTEELSPSTEIMTEETLQNIKHNTLLSYFNNNEEALNKFIGYFLSTYGELYTQESIMDIFYDVSQIPLEEKINDILEKYNMTSEQLDLVVACAMAEAWGHGKIYETSYAAASTMYNRINDVLFVDDVNKAFKSTETNAGYNPYYQVILANQFEVYGNGRYKEFLNKTSEVGYRAAIDMFYLGIPMHDYLNFLSNEYTPEEIKKDKNLDELPEQFFEDDNIFYTHLTSDRMIERNEKNFT